MTDTVLIVDDEEPVRRTFEEWLRGAGLNLRVFAAPDAETALTVANQHPIDLAVLDWNLGSGLDGLRLLEDLVLFHPDVVAILVTGFAHQATPLDALRMGVRDYLDKSSDLTREAFVGAVRRQLDRIRPAKRQRELNQSLATFREAVEKVLPLVRTAAALNDPVPLPEAVKSLLRFAGRAVGVTDGALVIHHQGADGTEVTVAYGATGDPLPTGGVPFGQSLAASVISFQAPAVLTLADAARSDGSLTLYPFEAGRGAVLAAPLPIGPGAVVVLELFDKPAPGFTDDDRRLVAAAAEVGIDLIRQAVAERQTHRLLFDAVEAALRASTGVEEAMNPAAKPDEPPPAAVMARLREGLDSDANAVVDGDTTLGLVEAVRALAVRHGPAAVAHCTRQVTDLRRLLDGLTGSE
ncbi:MAG: transcriptional regulator [Gemmataceae bacterium]|nr:transcriptional regulator [Gemmataceae bacterium]